MSRTAADILDTDGQCIRRQGEGCTFYYRFVDERPVEKAVHHDGRVGGTYDARDILNNIPASEVEVVDTSAWPAEGAV